MPNNKLELDKTRKHYFDGIFWGGYKYAPVPELVKHERIAIMEDHIDYIIVQGYDCGRSVWDPTVLVGEPYRTPLIGLGRPTLKRIESLKAAI